MHFFLLLCFENLRKLCYFTMNTWCHFAPSSMQMCLLETLALCVEDLHMSFEFGWRKNHHFYWLWEAENCDEKLVPTDAKSCRMIIGANKNSCIQISDFKKSILFCDKVVIFSAFLTSLEPLLIKCVSYHRSFRPTSLAQTYILIRNALCTCLVLYILSFQLFVSNSPVSRLNLPLQHQFVKKKTRLDLLKYGFATQDKV